MQYKISAYKGKVNSIIELKDSTIPVGSIQTGEDLFIICLEPIEARELAHADDEEEESSDESSG